MRNKYVQMSLLDIYHNVGKGLKNDKPELFKLLDEHINWDELVSDTFCHAFYQRFGRNRKCDLDSFIKSLFLQRIFHYVEDIRPLTTLRFSYEMADYCGFAKVPDATKLTCFKHDFYDYIRVVFERLVDLTEPIYREIIDEAFSDLLIFNTTGIESYVAENSLKYLNTQVGKNVKYSGIAMFSPSVKIQYINGYMCYVQRATVLINGLGTVRHLELFDEAFREKDSEGPRDTRTKTPEIDKKIGDFTSLKSVLRDFQVTHPVFRYGTFASDVAFGSYDNYAF